MSKKNIPRFCKFFLIQFISLVFAFSSTSEETAPSIESQITPIVQALLDAEYPGYLEVRVYKGGERFAKTYGCPKEGTQDSCKDVIFEIASITKVVTGVILARFVEEGRIKLEDPIRLHLPDSVTVPKFEGKEITILDLATQRSGLPRLPDDFDTVPGYDPKNPYATYTLEEMLAFLSRHTLRRAPGAEYEYSNYGVALLGNILALKAGKPYEELLSEYICAPLGLKNFSSALDDAQSARLVQGYNANSRLTSNWDLSVFTPAGGIRATADDLMTFMLVPEDKTDTPLRRAFALSLQPQYKVNDHLSMGLCWHIRDLQDTQEAMYWHNGSTGGYRSFAAVLPKSQLAIVVLGNVAIDKIDGVGLDILEAISGRNFAGD